MYKAANSIMLRFGLVRRFLNHVFYQYLSRLDKRGDVILMNYGYQNPDPEASMISMSHKDEDNRYSLQLYHHVASGIDIRGRVYLKWGVGEVAGLLTLSEHLRHSR